MYVGRIVGVGQANDGQNVGVYRVSSRSYPNRSAIIDSAGESAEVASREGAEKENEKSPYVAYMCLKVLEECVVLSNGNHTGPIADKITQGVSAKEALATTLSSMDYEKDELSTPRIAAVLPKIGNEAWLATVREDAVIVQAMKLQRGQMAYVATYEYDGINKNQVLVCTEGSTAEAFVSDAISTTGNWADLERPVTAIAVVSQGLEKSVDLAVIDKQGE
jgi:IMP cyclohydrolase